MESFRRTIFVAWPIAGSCLCPNDGKGRMQAPRMTPVNLDSGYASIRRSGDDNDAES